MSHQKRNKDRRRRKRRKARGAIYKSACEESSQSGNMSEYMKRLDCKVAKVDDGLGLVFGWAIVCTENGEPYVDSQNDHIPEHSMLKAVTKYAKGPRQGGDMHRCEDGTVIHEFPLTQEIAKAFGIETTKTGWMIAMEPTPETYEKFKSGERTGFSIGGVRKRDITVE